MNRKLIFASAALGLIAVVALAAFATGMADHGRGTASPSVATVECASAPGADAGAAGAGSVSPPAESAGDAQPSTEIKTGCGKPEPCPGRSCEDCPHNRLLK